jgi:hypothetical protein
LCALLYLDRDILPHLIVENQARGKWSQRRPLRSLLDC